MVIILYKVLILVDFFPNFLNIFRENKKFAFFDKNGGLTTLKCIDRRLTYLIALGQNVKILCLPITMDS